MKTASNFLIILSVLLIVTSCSVLKRDVCFKADTEGDRYIRFYINQYELLKKKHFFKADTAGWIRYEPSFNTYSHRIDSDSISIRTAILAEDAISVGPPVIPIFPKFLFFWVKKEDNSLNADVFFYINKPYTVNLEAIRFINKNEILLPYKIECITKDNNNSNVSIDYNLTIDNGIFKSKEPVRFRFYFKKNLKKVKQMDIYINSLIIDDKTIVLPSLKLKQKREYQYIPLIIAS